MLFKIALERIQNIKNNNIKVELQGVVHNLSSVLPSYDLMIARPILEVVSCKNIRGS